MKSIYQRTGFTLIEILIVLIILGILAAIVVPQFTNASTTARTNALSTAGQTLRSEVAYYKMQHNDKLPGAGSGTTFSSPQFWTDMTTKTDVGGGPYVPGQSTTGPFGPYIQAIPANAINASTTVIDAPMLPGGSVDTPCGWVYDFNEGKGSGRVFGTGNNFRAVQP